LVKLLKKYFSGELHRQITAVGLTLQSLTVRKIFHLSGCPFQGHCSVVSMTTPQPSVWLSGICNLGVRKVQ